MNYFNNIGFIEIITEIVKAVGITPEMINCTGCRVEGDKTPFCESLCPIRKCVMEKNYETCGKCSEIDKCEKIKMIIDNNEEALNNLRKS